MFEILFTGFLCLFLAYFLFWIAWWLYIVATSIKIAEEEKTPYDYIKFENIKKWTAGGAVYLGEKRIAFYRPYRSGTKEYLYTIHTPMLYIITVYGVAIISSPIELMKMCYYVYKLKRKYELSKSMHKQGLFNNKFN